MCGRSTVSLCGYSSRGAAPEHLQGGVRVWSFHCVALWILVSWRCSRTLAGWWVSVSISRPDPPIQGVIGRGVPSSRPRGVPSSRPRGVPSSRPIRRTGFADGTLAGWWGSDRHPVNDRFSRPFSPENTCRVVGVCPIVHQPVFLFLPDVPLLPMSLPLPEHLQGGGCLRTGPDLSSRLIPGTLADRCSRPCHFASIRETARYTAVFSFAVHSEQPLEHLHGGVRLGKTHRQRTPRERRKARRTGDKNDRKSRRKIRRKATRTIDGRAKTGTNGTGPSDRVAQAPGVSGTLARWCVGFASDPRRGSLPEHLQTGVSLEALRHSSSRRRTISSAISSAWSAITRTAASWNSRPVTFRICRSRRSAASTSNSASSSNASVSSRT